MKGFVLALLGANVRADETDYQYCLVGAGPGGVQLGHFLNMKGRSYHLFEKNSHPGSFFSEFPRHRHLISLNKRFTGRTDPKFNMRHDWNSLLETNVTPGTQTLHVN